jgi:hypothetical protein
MPISFACPTCHQQFTVPDRASGKRTSCPKCRTAFVIPGAVSSIKKGNPLTAATLPPFTFDASMPGCSSSVPGKRGMGKPVVFALIGLGAVLFVCVGLYFGLHDKIAGGGKHDMALTTFLATNPGTPTDFVLVCQLDDFYVDPNLTPFNLYSIKMFERGTNVPVQGYAWESAVHVPRRLQSQRRQNPL